MSALKSSIVDSLDEEYYQISPNILESFPKFRPPLDLYRFKEEIGQIIIYKKNGDRLDKDTQAELAGMCAEGNIFVARSDYPVYSKHISKQLDLILVDRHLNEREIAEIFRHALTDRLEAFLEQPVKGVFDLLYSDLMVLTEYLSADFNKIRSLTRRMHCEYSLAKHAFNSGVLGLWLYRQTQSGEISRRSLDRTCLAFFLQDVGMSKIPAFIREKEKPLTLDERSKIEQHPILGNQVVAKLDIQYKEVEEAVLQHQERLDGSGYPGKKKGDDIGLYSRIGAVADSFCAMVATRPWAQEKTPQIAIDELFQADTKYDRRFSGLIKSALEHVGGAKVFSFEECPEPEDEKE